MSFHKAYGTCTGPLSFPMNDIEARDLEKKLESGAFSPFKLQKAEAFEGVFEKERSEISVITDATIDKEGDVVDPDTLDFETFKKNPVVSYNHNYSIPPVGRALWFKKCAGNLHKAKTQYTSRPEEHPKNAEWFPDSIFHMVKSGSMKGKSLGGAVEWRSPTEADATRLGFDLTKANRISKQAIVFEYACCPIAMNNNAIVELIGKSALNLSDETLQNEFPEVWAELQEIKKKLPQIPLIKSFKTADQYKEAQNQSRDAKLAELEKSVPQIFDDVVKRMLGKVS